MPAKRKTRADRVAECFGELYRIGKARADLTEEQISTMIGYKSRDALLARRKDPLSFTLGQLLTMETVFRWRDEDWSQLVATMRGDK